MVEAASGLDQADQDHRQQHPWDEVVPPQAHRALTAFVHLRAAKQDADEEDHQEKQFISPHAHHHFIL